MGALTLVEAAKIAVNNGETKKAGVISLYAEKSDILAAMPFDGIMGNALTFTQEGSLPTTAFRAVNEGFTPSNGSFSPQTESLYAAGGDLDVDMFILQTQGEQVRGRHEGLKVKALAIGITDQIIKGDSATDARGFDGLQKRITGTQLVENGNTSGGDPLSLNQLDATIDLVDSPTHIIMSRSLRLKFTSAARSSVFPNIVMKASELGKQFWTYNDIPILVGYPQNSNTKILPYTEAGGGGGTTSTSIYVVNFSEDGVMGIQSKGIDVRDLGELDTLPVKRTRVEWYMSMVAQSPYAAARLRGISNAAIAP
jgi:hypothetical protein